MNCYNHIDIHHLIKVILLNIYLQGFLTVCFVAETEEVIYIIEAKAKNEINDAQVLAKKEVAVQWCQYASDYMLNHGGKPWKYVLIPHDAIQENKTLKGLSDRYTMTTKC